MIRQLLTESLLPAAAGGLAGLLAGYWVRSALWPIRLPLLRRVIFESALDLQAFAFTAAIALLSALICSLAPALQTFGTDIASALKGQAGLNRYQRGITVFARTQGVSVDAYQ